MNDKVTVSQISLLYLLVVAGGKFLKLSSLLAKDVGHDSWIVFAIAFACDGVCIAFLCWAIKLNAQSKLAFNNVLRLTVGKYVATAVYVVFFVMFLLRALILLSSCYKMFVVTFDVSTNWLVFVLPVVLITTLVVSLGFNSVARTAELIFSVVLISVFALIFSPISQVQLSSLLPIGEAGWGNIFVAFFKRSFWFSDYVFVFFVLDKIRVKRQVFAPMFLSFAVGVVATIAMNVVFTSLSGSLAVDFDNAMSKIGIFSLSSSASGRWDWLTLSVWLLSVFVKVVTFLYCAYKCVQYALNKPFVKTNYLALACVCALLILPIFVAMENALDAVVKYAGVAFALVQYALPLFLPLMVTVARRKKEAM